MINPPGSAPAGGTEFCRPSLGSSLTGRVCVLLFHAPADPDYDLPGAAASDSAHKRAGQCGSAAGSRQPAVAGAVPAGGPGGGPRRVLDPSGVARGAVAVALPCHSPFLEGARLD